MCRYQLILGVAFHPSVPHDPGHHSRPYRGRLLCLPIPTFVLPHHAALLAGRLTPHVLPHAPSLGLVHGPLGSPWTGVATWA